MVRRIWAVRGKSGLKLVSRQKIAGRLPYSERSSLVRASAGVLNSPVSEPAPWRTTVTVPLSARTSANAPGMPPVERTSALFWKTSR
jgi:hypothetical protein